jgi:hypothetical protein
MKKGEAESYIGKTVYTVFEGTIREFVVDAAVQAKHKSRRETECPWFIECEHIAIAWHEPIITDRNEATDVALAQLAANIAYERGQVAEAEANIDRYEAQAKKLRVLRDLRPKQ